MQKSRAAEKTPDSLRSLWNRKKNYETRQFETTKKEALLSAPLWIVGSIQILV
jgi:hypothetical protein